MVRSVCSTGLVQHHSKALLPKSSGTTVCTICRIDAWVTRQIDNKETIEVQHNDGTVKNFKLAEVRQMQNKGILQWVSPAEAVKQSLDGMLRYSFSIKNLCSISSAVCYIKYRAYDCCSTCAIMIWSLLLLPYQPVDREEWHVFGLCIATSMLDCASCMSLISSHAFTLKTNHRHVSTGSLVVPAQEVLLWWQHDKCRAAVTQHSPARG